MAQKRHREYKDPVDSQKHNRANVGILPPGRYCGFDTINNVSGLTFDLEHGNTGIKFSALGVSLTPFRGQYLSPMGVKIEEDAPITGLSTVTNVGNLVTRIDTIVAEHEFIAVQGGQAAIYFVLPGNFGSNVATALPNPGKQVALGYLSIPAGESDLLNAVYTPNYVPSLGNANIITNYPILDQRYAIKANVNLMGKLNTGHTAAAFGSIAAGLWSIPDDGPTYVYPLGSGSGTINEIAALSTLGIAAGYSTDIFIVNNSVSGLTINLDGTPAQGGLPILAGFLANFKTTLGLVFGDWVWIKWINGGYVVMDTSVVKREDLVDHDGWITLTTPELLALAFTVNYQQNTAQIAVTPGAGGVVIWWKKIGKTLHLEFYLANLFNSPTQNLADFVSLFVNNLPANIAPKRNIKAPAYMQFNTPGGIVKQSAMFTIDTSANVTVELYDYTDIETSVGIVQIAANVTYELP